MILAVALVAVFCAPVISAEKATINGTVKDGQIVTDDGKAYSLAESDKGKEVAAMAGKKVKATGLVEEKEGKMTIDISEYEVLE